MSKLKMYGLVFGIGILYCLAQGPGCWLFMALIGMAAMMGD